MSTGELHQHSLVYTNVLVYNMTADVRAKQAKYKCSMEVYNGFENNDTEEVHNCDRLILYS